MQGIMILLHGLMQEKLRKNILPLVGIWIMKDLGTLIGILYYLIEIFIYFVIFYRDINGTKKIREWFASSYNNRRNLLIFDNVKDKDEINNYIPGFGAHVIITTPRIKLLDFGKHI